MKLFNNSTTKLNLYQGDILDALEQLKPESADLIVADYPFNAQDGREDYVGFLESTITGFNKIAKEMCNLVIIQNPFNAFKMGRMLDDWNLINEISLIRRGALRPAWHFGFQHNTALILNKGGIKEKWNGATKNHDKSFPTDVIEYQNGYRGKTKKHFHPQAINIELSDTLVSILSNPKDLVFDAFTGSGTVALSCANLDRHYLGVELNPNYVDTTKDRILRSGYEIQVNKLTI